MVDMPSIPEIYLLLASAMEVAVMRLNGKTFCTRADVAITEPCLKAEPGFLLVGAVTVTPPLQVLTTPRPTVPP